MKLFKETDKLYCEQCWTKGGYGNKQRNVKWVKKESTGGTSAIASKFGGGGVKCEVCEKSVYPAELVRFEKKNYHAQCMKCTGDGCDKKLSASTANLFENKLYCKKCFEAGGFARKQRNVKWVKKEGTSSGTASKYGGGGVNCAICDKKVYPAEQISFEKKAYHGNCFKCSEEDCQKKLTASQAALFEDRLVCRKCFAAKGYNRQQAKSATTNKSGSSAPVDSRFAKFGGGGESCKLCGGKVYSAEKISFEKNAYCTKCFVCQEPSCGKKLIPSTAEWRKEDESIHCQKCFQNKGYHLA